MTQTIDEKHIDASEKFPFGINGTWIANNCDTTDNMSVLMDSSAEKYVVMRLIVFCYECTSIHLCFVYFAINIQLILARLTCWNMYLWKTHW